jgi:Fur family ferric uptake transcriptional regulator
MKRIPPEALGRLSELGLRLTAQRRAVVAAALSRRGHFSPDELAVRLYAADPPVSRATVYRLLPDLARAGLIRQVIYAEGHTHYEAVRDDSHHEHLICEACGAILEFASPEIEEALARVSAEHGFAEQHHKVEITGLCARCKSRQSPTGERNGLPRSK